MFACAQMFSVSEQKYVNNVKHYYSVISTARMYR